MKIFCIKTEGFDSHHTAGRELLKIAMKKEYGIDSDKCVVLKKEMGKPYFRDYPNIFFNISHSGEYAVCAVGDEEIGIDIQENKKIRREVCERFLDSCEPEIAAREWAKREAYGKYTGEGALGKREDTNCVIREYFIAEGYYMFACAKNDCFPKDIIFC